MIPIMSFIETYGYLATFVGAIFEGESVVLLGGLASHSEYTVFALVVLCASLGAVVGDWFFFFLGRYKRNYILTRFPYFKKLIQKPTVLVEKNPRVTSFTMRFMYGFRHVVPFSIGTTTIPTHQFLLWNTFGAVTWAITFTSIGYLTGDILENMLGTIGRYEFRIIVLTIVVLIVLNFIVRSIRAWLIRKNGCHK